ncbi:outer membrane lipid asymmetry maintenance protein MlaD [Maribrevibacterium harenarium]|uniref:Outer membrane lipid asymmetry maintenance protein MlaD n=1 Tax=Maribrevibacterium harenarium TaxID=2589817 RepID=A0A501WZ85_9GAMM|nr:outer membrane lipid asymmetry maintenance protein MlaD [Maribrevibacterium harenarium]TPE52351.1 outer membrane lipid asymmetry maintenance protein MlaD [Maribrevibacterium harenarium]
MRNKHTELLVGIFVILGLSAFAYLAIQVSGLAFSKKDQGYTLIARFDDIGGLTERAKVTIAGVTIGEVKSITFDKEYFMGKVTMSLDADVNNIPVDSSAAILTSGLLGEKYIGISIGAESDVLKDGDEIFDTQSALVLENLIGQFLFNSSEE